MIYKLIYRTEEPFQKHSITYCLCEENGHYYIESSISGSDICETVSLGNCGEEKSEYIVRLFAKKSVHPFHTDSIISDMRL